jgi:hypothetical protein
MSLELDRIFGISSASSSATSPSKKRKNKPSECTKVGYRVCRKRGNTDCRWVYGSKRKQKTGVKKRHCRTRKNQPRQ